jgi:hypothetical protein
MRDARRGMRGQEIRQTVKILTLSHPPSRAPRLSPAPWQTLTLSESLRFLPHPRVVPKKL